MIIKEVQLNGEGPETWIKLANTLGKKGPEVVKSFYENYIKQTPKVKGPFSPEEDEIILSHVEEHGRSIKSFKDLAKFLGRGSAGSVEIRYKKLISKNDYEVNAKPKSWDFDEDKVLISHAFNLKDIKPNDASSLEKMKPSEFSNIATELKRSSSSCYGRWMIYIVPALKTHIKKLPMTNEWKKDVLKHIVANKIKRKKEMDIDLILKEITPGQTSLSLLKYLRYLKAERVDGVSKQSEKPLFDLASKRLREPSPTDPVFDENHRREQRLVWTKELISYYKTLI